MTAAAPLFAHPVEAEFARILDFYGIPWQYEPRTFALESDAQGKVTQGFSPDFYLPEQDLYIELTTMQPHQIRHKNRKIRRLRELHPEINVKLFKRGDIRNLLIKFGLDDFPNYWITNFEQGAAYGYPTPGIISARTQRDDKGYSPGDLQRRGSASARS